ncbi:phosphoenolpyruvate carboxylase, partial [Cytophagia bacterium CHB2]|nr:phosphoenolpyruvate carboxylase [Cytophagia bacterium CHB2]
MKHWQGLMATAEGTGISEPLSLQVNLLGELLGHAIREVVGKASFEQVEKLRTLCKAVYLEDHPQHWQQAAAEISKLKPEEILWLLRAFTTFFHLVNKAEQREIVRINRERERRSTAAQPRTESLAEAIHFLNQSGYTRDEVLALLARLDIQPTLTAHPTEARRRAILVKQRSLAHLLEQLQQSDLTPAERDAKISAIYEKICLLLVSDEFRSEKISVADEVQHGLHFLTNAIWETVPRIYRDLRAALAACYQTEVDLPAILRYRSWIGGDRDGNPFVTPDVTQNTLALLRAAVIKLYAKELRALREELSLSSRLLEVPAPLLQALHADRQRITL